MSNLILKKMMDQITLVRYLEGTADIDERRKVDEWMNANDKNLKEFNMAKEILNEEKDHSFNPNTDKALKQVLDKLPEQKSESKPLNTRWLQIAAAFILTFGVAVFILQKTAEPEVETIVYEYNESTEGRISLPDGSVVWLREGSKLLGPEEFKGKNRKVKFVGEGYFEVNTNPEKPFLIEANGTLTRVLGTKFLLNAAHADSSVSLVLDEGRVQFTTIRKSSKNKVELEPGERVKFNPKTQQITSKKNTNLNYAAWKTGSLSFNDNTVLEIVHDMEDFYNIQFGGLPEEIRRQAYSFTVPKGENISDAIETFSLTINKPIAKKGEFYYIQPTENDGE